MLNASGFDFGSGGGSGRKTEYLLIAALVAVIVGTLGFTVYYMFIRPDGPTPPGEFRMYCLKCNKDITISRDDFLKAQNQSAAGPSEPAGPPGMPRVPFMPQQRATCPSCKTPSLILKRHCSKCDTWFVAEWDKTHSPMETSPGMPMPLIVCPNCKTPQSTGLPGPGMPMVPGGPMPGGPAPTPAPTGNGS